MQNEITKKTREVFKDPKLIELAVDAKEYKDHAIDWVNMFLWVYRIDEAGYQSFDEIPRFYISELIADLKTLDRKERESLEKFFGIGATKNYLKVINQKDVALINLATSASNAAMKLQSVNRMYKYNKEFSGIFDSIAGKVFDPEGRFTNVQKAKLAHLYYWFIKDFQYMPYDKENDGVGNLLTEGDVKAESRGYLSVDAYKHEWKHYFSKLPDNDIIASQIIEFIWESDTEEDNLMVKFAELTDEDGIKGKHEGFTGRLYPMCCTQIRMAKEKLFSTGEWSADYMSFSTFSKLSLEKVESFIQGYHYYKHELEYEIWRCRNQVKRSAFFRTTGKKTIWVPRLSRFNFRDEYEMIHFLNLISYVQKYAPEYLFHEKAFEKYGFLKKIA